MTVIILRRTTSSPEESLGSNLQWDTVLLSSASATSAEGASGEIKPHANKLCKDVKATEVMGPVDNGDRIMAKKGVRRSKRGMADMSGKITWSVLI